MPTPPKTSLAALIDIARELIEANGLDGLTVSAVAQQAGVKAPSLYKHFADRAALLRVVEISILHDLEASLRQAMKGRSATAQLKTMAHAYRRFAAARPQHYALLYRQDALADPEIAAACVFAAQPMFEQLRASGIPEARVLPLARTLTAFLHGFVSMEIARAFRFGGSLDDAFEDGISTILAALD